MKKTTLKSIDKFINKITKSLYKYDMNLYESKEEIKSHLINKINELILNNYDEETALKKAISDFGDSELLTRNLDIMSNKNSSNLIFKILTYGYSISAFFLILVYFIALYICTDNFFSKYGIYFNRIGQLGILLLTIFSISFIIFEIINSIKAKKIYIFTNNFLTNLLLLFQLSILYLKLFGSNLYFIEETTLMYIYCLIVIITTINIIIKQKK